MKVALVNSNRIRPPIAPIGLEYVAEALAAAGHEPLILDLAWAEDVDAAVDDFFSGCEVPLVGITLRNTDDCAFTIRHSFLEEQAAQVRRIRDNTDGMLVLGGVGFSVMPREVLTVTGADAGIRGEGEFSFPLLADRLERKLAVMFDLLLGAPGETRESILAAVDLVRRSKADQIGISLGVRIWPETELAKQLRTPPCMEGLVGGKGSVSPRFYLDPAVAAEAADWIEGAVGDDERFLFFNPKNAASNYNYDNNEVLENAIRAGYRGAYWDILRKLRADANRTSSPR